MGWARPGSGGWWDRLRGGAALLTLGRGEGIQRGSRGPWLMTCLLPAQLQDSLWLGPSRSLSLWIDGETEAQGTQYT